MDLSPCPVAWMDGEFVPIRDAVVPVTTHALHYGTSAFEGIRAYWNGENLHVFRLDDHIRRLRRSGGFYNMTLKHTDEEMARAVTGVCNENSLRESVYIRPFYFVGDWGINLQTDPGAPTRAVVMAFPMEKYLDDSGISACVVSCRRLSDQMMPTQAKMGGNYLNSIGAILEAKRGGFDEALMLDHAGNVSEASGANIFLVQDGSLVTPDAASSALNGITQDTVIRLARERGIATARRRVSLAELYVSDEVFLTGTAAEVTPVVRIGDHTMEPGPVTRDIMRLYSDAVCGKGPVEWLTPVY